MKRWRCSSVWPQSASPPWPLAGRGRFAGNHHRRPTPLSFAADARRKPATPSCAVAPWTKRREVLASIIGSEHGIRQRTLNGAVHLFHSRRHHPLTTRPNRPQKPHFHSPTHFTFSHNTQSEIPNPQSNHQPSALGLRACRYGVKRGESAPSDSPHGPEVPPSLSGGEFASNGGTNPNPKQSTHRYPGPHGPPLESACH